MLLTHYKICLYLSQELHSQKNARLSNSKSVGPLDSSVLELKSGMVEATLRENVDNNRRFLMKNKMLIIKNK